MCENYLWMGKEIPKEIRDNSSQIPHGARSTGLN